EAAGEGGGSAVALALPDRSPLPLPPLRPAGPRDDGAGLRARDPPGGSARSRARAEGRPRARRADGGRGRLAARRSGDPGAGSGPRSTREPGDPLRAPDRGGDNTPLPLAAPRLLLPAHRLRFFYPAAAGPLTLLYGQPGLPPPRYDLSLLAPRLLGEAAHELTLGPPARKAPEPDAAAAGRKAFWGALVAAVVVLLLVLGRLLRGQPEAPSS